MSYFNNFDFIAYDFTIKGETPIVETIVDLTERVQLKISKEDLAKFCDDYVIPDGMKPEQIASVLYNDPFKHWTILYINNINDVHSDWPMSDAALHDFIVKKYGVDNVSATHHYEKMPERLVVDEAFCKAVYNEDAVLVTNAEYEATLNDLKRFIKVIKPEYIVGFVKAFNEAIVK